MVGQIARDRPSVIFHLDDRCPAAAQRHQIAFAAIPRVDDAIREQVHAPRQSAEQRAGVLFSADAGGNERRRVLRTARPPLEVQGNQHGQGNHQQHQHQQHPALRLRVEAHPQRLLQRRKPPWRTGSANPPADRRHNHCAECQVLLSAAESLQFLRLPFAAGMESCHKQLLFVCVRVRFIEYDAKGAKSCRMQLTFWRRTGIIALSLGDEGQGEQDSGCQRGSHRLKAPAENRSPDNPELPGESRARSSRDRGE